MRVLKYLRGHIPAVALIVLLLVAQSCWGLWGAGETSPHLVTRHHSRGHA